MITSDRGLGPHRKRDVAAAAAAGRFQVADPELALLVIGGALLGLGQFLHEQPQRDDGETTDQVVESSLGMSCQEAQQLCRKPLPDFGDVGGYVAS